MRALDRILSALDEEPIEDGVSHSAEGPLTELIRVHGSAGVLGAVFGAEGSSRTAATLRNVVLALATNEPPPAVRR